MSDIESMKAELEAAGYRVQSKSMTQVLRTIDDALTNNHAPYQAVFTTIESAYAHLLREKKFAAMEALLEELSEAKADLFAPNNNWYYHGYNVLMDFKTKAKKLLDKE